MSGEFVKKWQRSDPGQERSGIVVEWQLVIAGMAIGVAVAAPIGPINILCIQRSLKQGFFAGLLAGMGAVLGDGTYAAIAVYSITSVSQVLTENSFWIELIGGLFLIGLGGRALLTNPVYSARPQNLNILDNTTLVGTTYVMTITNPAMILGFVGFFGSAGSLIELPQDYLGATVLVVAVMMGSFVWWVFLAGIMHRFRRNIGPHAIVIINRASGIIIALFGVVVLLRLVIAKFDLW